LCVYLYMCINNPGFIGLTESEYSNKLTPASCALWSKLQGLISVVHSLFLWLWLYI